MRPLVAACLVLLAACSPAEPDQASTSTEATPEQHASASAAKAAAEASDAPAQPTVIDRGDGLTVEVERAGAGVEVAGDSSVTLHYRAFVAGAEKPFDSSYDAGLPLDVKLGAGARPRLIDGLARGLVGLRAGSKAKLKIPAALGWGSAGNEGSGVPKDADLVYEVEVVGVR
jgi:FKBP-type peptidyl-prolyl cis-trans isomerase